MSSFVLVLNNFKFQKFTDIRIRKTLHAMAGSIQLQTLNFFPGKPASWDFTLSKPYSVSINNEQIISGYMDTININYKRRTHLFSLMARDITADLIDCDYVETTNEWKTQTVQAIITQLCSPFSISVSVDSQASSDASKTIDTFKANEGEKVSNMISRLCSQFGIIPIAAGNGRLTLTKAVTDIFANDAIEVNANVIESNSLYSNTDRYSQYTVKGYGYGNNNKQLADFIQPNAAVTDSVVERYRPLEIFSEINTDNGKCESLAKSERQLRAGMSRPKTYIVPEWKQSNGENWKINTLVRIRDGLIGIDKDMLISDVVYMYNETSGYTTQISVVDKNTFTSNDVRIKSEFDE
jgi:prophage tail gpP-like protein